ncbi:MAG TPA: tRNA 2-thiouridine(34) synthase MnmA [Anaerolineales bacterium]|nr:tRNA 2-thiouridine(34) synthase MnmA [Anaerolineales bacterium]
MNLKPVVAVAMSGGVDSSVTAALLVDQGYTVIGIMLRLWSEENSSRANRCCTPDSIALARRVAATLSIPFYVLDTKQLFYDTVVTSFIDDYTHNITPNPCITCNRLVRWGFLYNYALSAGADFLATGHYARLVQRPDHTIQLMRGVDPQKDQSYVLHVLNQEQLAHARFPLGEYRKPEVRDLAQIYGLPVADRPDSQDLCFVGENGDYRSFLIRHAPHASRPGSIVDIQGKVLGQHEGLAFYTIGQRKGLHISAPSPLYVLRKDVSHNTITVGSRDQITSQQCIVRQVNWIAEELPQSRFAAQIKTRYTAHEIPAMVEVMEGNQIKVQFENPVLDVTPGQAAVLYNGEVCLGGGIITNPSE